MHRTSLMTRSIGYIMPRLRTSCCITVLLVQSIAAMQVAHRLMSLAETTLQRGTLTVALGNPPAIAKGTRGSEASLARLVGSLTLVVSGPCRSEPPIRRESPGLPRQGCRGKWRLARASRGSWGLHAQGCCLTGLPRSRAGSTACRGSEGEGGQGRD